jgi:hypothetical protein
MDHAVLAEYLHQPVCELPQGTRSDRVVSDKKSLGYNAL